LIGPQRLHPENGACRRRQLGTTSNARQVVRRFLNWLADAGRWPASEGGRTPTSARATRGPPAPTTAIVTSLSPLSPFPRASVFSVVSASSHTRHTTQPSSRCWIHLDGYPARRWYRNAALGGGCIRGHPSQRTGGGVRMADRPPCPLSTVTPVRHRDERCDRIRGACVAPSRRARRHDAAAHHITTESSG
jgi:hypothetical protein